MAPKASKLAYIIAVVLAYAGESHAATLCTPKLLVTSPHSESLRATLQCLMPTKIAPKQIEEYKEKAASALAAFINDYCASHKISVTSNALEEYEKTSETLKSPQQELADLITEFHLPLTLIEPGSTNPATWNLPAGAQHTIAVALSKPAQTPVPLRPTLTFPYTLVSICMQANNTYFAIARYARQWYKLFNSAQAYGDQFSAFQQKYPTQQDVRENNINTLLTTGKLPIQASSWWNSNSTTIYAVPVLLIYEIEQPELEELYTGLTLIVTGAGSS